MPLWSRLQEANLQAVPLNPYYVAKVYAGQQLPPGRLRSEPSRNHGHLGLHPSPESF